MTVEPDTGLVVIVEDPFIHTFLRTALNRAGHHTTELNVQNAVDLLCSGRHHVKALITNTPRPFLSVAADIPLIYTTSCPDPGATEGFSHWCIVRKPFHAGQLLEAVHDVSNVVLP